MKQTLLFRPPVDTARAEMLNLAEFKSWLRATQDREIDDVDPVDLACLWDQFRDDMRSQERDRLEPTFGQGAVVDGATYFCSGSNHPGEIEGLARAGLNPGVAVDKLTKGAPFALAQLAGTGLLVFADSGAFGEADFSGGAPTWPNPITHEDWEERLSLYERLAAALGPQLYCVAPDRVADQQGTLERMRRYADRVREIAELDARIIVPVQQGLVPMAEFWPQALSALGLDADEAIAGIPSRKDATTVECIAEFYRIAQPKQIHLLGIGPASAGFRERLQVLRGAKVSCDSVRICALVGRDGKGGAARPLTAKRDQIIAAGMDAPTRDVKQATIASHFLGEQQQDQSHYERDLLADLPARTTVVNVRGGKVLGSDFDVYCGRWMRQFPGPCGVTLDGKALPSGWYGNPHKGEGAIDCFRQYLFARIGSDPLFARSVDALKGKRLGCWCAPAPCHCDVYVSYLEGP